MNLVGVFILMSVAVAGISSHNPLSDDALSALLQEITVDWNAGFLSGNVSDKKLAKLFDPEDVRYMLPDTETLTSPQAIIDASRALLGDFPSDLVLQGTQIEAYSYKFKGRKLHL